MDTRTIDQINKLDSFRKSVLRLIEQTPVFETEFVTALKDKLKYETNIFICMTGTGEEIRIQQGRVRMLTDILNDINKFTKSKD